MDPESKSKENITTQDVLSITLKLISKMKGYEVKQKELNQDI